MDNNNKEATLREFKVGDIVWDCIRHGKGRVINTSDETVTVVFDSKQLETYTYKKDGKFYPNHSQPSLYHQPYKIELLEVPEELPEVGTPVYVWDDNHTQSRIAFFKGKPGRLYETCQFFPFTGSQNHWQNMSLTLPDKFK